MSIKYFKALKDFKILLLAFFPLTFGISSGKHLLLTKFSIFLKSTSLLLAIFLKFICNQKGKRSFNWSKTFDVLIQTYSTLYSEKTGVP